ncbi:MAG: hypothetical protein QG583_833 [Patescibacteria group bacterium]|nr:hypothetical protein [Patescibacteria group bacterium]
MKTDIENTISASQEEKFREVAHVCIFFADPFENSPRVLRCKCGKIKLNPDFKTPNIGFHFLPFYM